MRAHKIGEGAFGEVHVIFNGDQPVTALKSMKRNDMQHELRCEFAMAKRLRHKNFVKTFAFWPVGFKQLGPCIEMEYIEGPNLLDLLRYKTLRRWDLSSIKYLSDMQSAVVHLHELQLVHGDIKLENIMFSPAQDALKIVDAGLMTHSNSTVYTDHFFTRGYEAMEIVLAGGSCAACTSMDVYALGITMLQLGCGVWLQESFIASRGSFIMTELSLEHAFRLLQSSPCAHWRTALWHMLHLRDYRKRCLILMMRLKLEGARFFNGGRDLCAEAGAGPAR